MAQFSSDGRSAIERSIDSVNPRERTPVEQLDSVYELQKCVEWIRTVRAEKICLQFPDKLLPDSFEVSLCLQKLLSHKQVYILGDTSYGSCCVDEVTAQHVNADAIIHFGHACLSPTDRIPVLYIFEKYYLDVELFVSEFRSTFPVDCKVILIYDVAYEHCIRNIREKLCSYYKNLHVPTLCINQSEIGTTIICGRCFNTSRENIINEYSVVFIGKNERTFQNIALELAGTKLFIFDPIESNTLCEHQISNNKFLMKRMFLIEKVKDARIVGILVGTLGVSRYLDAVDRIKKLSKEKGKKCYIVVVGKPNVPKLANFPEIDVFVLLACPENSFIEEKFFKPLVTVYDFELACNPNRPWTNYYHTNFRDILSDTIETDVSTTDIENVLSNVSLTGGHLQNMGIFQTKEKENISVSDTVALKSDTTLSLYGASGSHYLANRSWRGLEQDLGQTKVEYAAKGRSGIPLHYENEPNTQH